MVKVRPCSRSSGNWNLLVLDIQALNRLTADLEWEVMRLVSLVSGIRAGFRNGVVDFEFIWVGLMEKKRRAARA